MSKESLRKLFAYLGKERQAILDRSFQDLEYIRQGIDLEIKHIEATPVDQNSLIKLHKLSMSNMKLLKAAISGIRDAKMRLSGRSMKSESLRTYDSAGQYTYISDNKSKIEKKL